MIEKTISALADQIRGVSYNKRDLHDKLDENSIILLRANNIVKGKLNFRDVVYVDKNVVSADQYLKDGDILISASSGSKKMVGKAASFHSKDKCTFGAFCKVVRPHDNIKEFLRIYFQSATYRREISHLALGANINNIRNEHINSLQVRVPDYRTRLQIIKVINTLQKIRDVRKQELKKLDELIKARFVEMFGDPISNKKSWKKRLLNDLVDKIGSGATPKGGKESYQDHGISFIRSMNVHDGYFNYKDLAYINSTQAKQLSNVIVQSQDVFINITGASVARSCIVPDDILPARVNQHVSIIRCKSDVLNPIFINNLFLNDSFKRILLSIGLSGGATRQAITKKQLEMLKIILPPLSLQNKFANFVQQVDKSKVVIQKSLDETQKLYDSLMQEYFG